MQIDCGFFMSDQETILQNSRTLNNDNASGQDLFYHDLGTVLPHYLQETYYSRYPAQVIEILILIKFFIMDLCQWIHLNLRSVAYKLKAGEFTELYQRKESWQRSLTINMTNSGSRKIRNCAIHTLTDWGTSENSIDARTFMKSQRIWSITFPFKDHTDHADQKTKGWRRIMMVVSDNYSDTDAIITTRRSH